jgi:carotenoid cleavage dioxygenase-like enzyme
VPGYDELVSFAVETGRTQRYSFGTDWLVEEHVLVPDAADPSGPAQWAVGTALDLQRGRTVLSVFRADQISDGPVAQATLPYAMPIALHGCFVPGSR